MKVIDDAIWRWSIIMDKWQPLEIHLLHPTLTFWILIVLFPGVHKRRNFIIHIHNINDLCAFSGHFLGIFPTNKDLIRSFVINKVPFQLEWFSESFMFLLIICVCIWIHFTRGFKTTTRQKADVIDFYHTNLIFSIQPHKLNHIEVDNLWKA